MSAQQYYQPPQEGYPQYPQQVSLEFPAALMVSLPHKVTTLRKVKCNINSSSLLLSRVVAGMDASKGA
ncbi:hypothetical protein B0H65DRAFT_553126 [Neurospora tetraspora]|uniref:Uncharacterized protein n=1 Tax=Neurospora tetraspora TaxID=94610 RepID=A0AAE0MJD6_9PEZI|nr:hypothetical protein B0H65DRAFT_553126 [Neurospora tetraspora]